MICGNCTPLLIRLRRKCLWSHLLTSGVSTCGHGGDKCQGTPANQGDLRVVLRVMLVCCPPRPSHRIQSLLEHHGRRLVPGHFMRAGQLHSPTMCLHVKASSHGLSLRLPPHWSRSEVNRCATRRQEGLIHPLRVRIYRVLAHRCSLTNHGSSISCLWRRLVSRKLVAAGCSSNQSTSQSVLSVAA
jgi:hypothetical protein